MTKQTAEQFLKLLEGEMQQLHLDTAFLDGEGAPQIGNTLRILLPAAEGKGALLMDVMVTEFEEEKDLVHFYTTILPNIGPGYEAIKEVIQDWNLLCPLGAFGVYRQEMAFYHKYALAIDRASAPEALCAQALYLIELFYGIIDEHYLECVRLSGHSLADS